MDEVIQELTAAEKAQLLAEVQDLLRTFEIGRAHV